MVSAFSSHWNDLHAWKYCSLVLPNFEYCWQKQSLNACQSNCTVPDVSYHNLASPVGVKQNLLAF